MSLRATLWALYEAPAKDPTARLVLVVLADHAGDDGRDAFPSVARIASAAEVTERTVQRHLRDLEEAGLIVKGDQARVEAAIKRGDRRPVCYDLQLGVVRGDNMTPRDTPDGVTPTSPRDENGVTPMTERGDTGDAHGVTPVSPEPKDEPTTEPKNSAPQADAQMSDDEIRELDTLPGDPKIAKRWAELKGHAAATAWHDKLKADGVKIQNPERAWNGVRTMVIAALAAGFSRRQVWTALVTLGDPFPAQKQWDTTLRLLDQKVGNVNDAWKGDHEPPPMPEEDR